MIMTIGQLAAFVGCGMAWRWLKPMQVEAASLRRGLTSLLYYIILPVLVFTALLNTPFNTRTLLVAGSAILTTVITLAISWLWLRSKTQWSSKLKSTLILAAVFSNVAFSGYPILVHIYGDWAGRLAMIYFVAGVFPVLLLLGFLHTRNHRDLPPGLQPAQLLLRFPLVWALAAGIAGSLVGLQLPQAINEWINLLIFAATPLMLIAVGLSLRWSNKWNRIAKKILPITLIQVLVMPLIMWLILNYGLEILGPKTNQSLILLAGMPAAVLGLDLCERYGLEAAVYQINLTMSTIISVLSLSIIYLAL